MAEDKVIIKRYPNRRLYDTQQSKYINMDDLSQLLVEGKDILVRDASTKEDITAAVLLQVIIDREKRHIGGLPVELLKELIVLQDTPEKRWFDMSMEQSLQFLRQVRSAGWQMPTGSASKFFEPSFWMGQMLPNAEQPAERPVATESEPAPEPEAASSKSDLSSELLELKRRLEELERRSK